MHPGKHSRPERVGTLMDMRLQSRYLDVAPKLFSVRKKCSCLITALRNSLRLEIALATNTRVE